jgi:DNA-binding protein YbaB
LGGRPAFVDAISEKKLKDEHGGDKRIQLNEDESRAMINAEIRATAVRRGQAPSQVKRISNKNLTNLEVRLDIESRNAEETSDAREKACASVRNMTSVAAAIISIKKTAKRGLLINFDAKTSILGDRKLTKPKAKFIRGAKKGAEVKGKGKKKGRGAKGKGRGSGVKNGLSVKVRKGKRKGITGYLIKSMYTLADCGLLGEMVHILASPGMPANTMHVLKCDGLGISGLMKGDPVTIVFAESRTKLPKEFHLDVMWNGIIFPFEKKLRDILDFPADVPENKSSTFMDGGDDQLYLFKEPPFQETLKVKNMRAINPPGSTTEVTQSADQRIFKTINNFLKSMEDTDIPHSRSEEFIAVSEMIAKHQNYLQDNKLKLLTTEHVKQAIDGLLRLSVANQKTINSHTIKGSFIDVAQDVTLTDLETIVACINNCTTKMTTEDEGIVIEAVPSLVPIFDELGMIPEKEYDDRNIPVDVNEKGKPKDQRICAQQRTVDVTNMKSQERLLVEKNKSVVAKEKRVVAAQKKSDAVDNGTVKPVKAYVPKLK